VDILLFGKYLRVKEKELFLRRESVVLDFVKNSNFINSDLECYIGDLHLFGRIPIHLFTLDFIDVYNGVNTDKHVEEMSFTYSTYFNNFTTL
jgi:hypothetical protein